MKFTIHTLRPARDGETPTHAGSLTAPTGFVVSSLGVEAEDLTQAVARAVGIARPFERLMAWSPEPSRSHGGSKGHRQLYEEAIRAGRQLIGQTFGRHIALGTPEATAAVRDAVDKAIVDANVVDAEVTSTGLTAMLVRKEITGVQGRWKCLTHGNFHDNAPGEGCHQCRSERADLAAALMQATGRPFIEPNAEYAAAVQKRLADSAEQELQPLDYFKPAAPFDPFKDFAVVRGGAAGHYPSKPKNPLTCHPDLQPSGPQIDPGHASAATDWHGR